MRSRRRRKGLPFFVTVGALLAYSVLVPIRTAWADGAPSIILQNEMIQLEVEPIHGTISGIVDKASGIELASIPELAENFRLQITLPDKKAVTVYGKDQKLSDSRIDGNRLLLRWEGPLTDADGRTYDIPVQMKVEEDGSGLEFDVSLENKTPYTVREVWYPFIGGFSRFAAPADQPDATIWAPTSRPWVKKIDPTFESQSFGYPGQLNMSFICTRNSKTNRSFYWSSQDKIARYKTYHFLKLSKDGAEDVAASVQHHPFVRPGEHWDGSPVVMEFVDGDWKNAGQVYREWFKNTFGIMDPDKCWIRKESFFQMTMFMLPEGTICYRFRDIPKWAKAAKDHGVNAVMISGWQMGGHDNGYPLYTPDPRLGTWQELEDGIKACHKMGLKVYFFVNYQPMMADIWSKTELRKYLEMREDGKPTRLGGWPMGTLWARMGHPKRMSWADLGFPEFRRIILNYFVKLAQIGADGVHVDKMFPAALSFNPDSPMSPDTSTWEGPIILTRDIMKECRKYNPDWAISFETNWDRMLEFTDSTWWVGNAAIERSAFPEHVETLAIANAYDYLGVNNAVRNRHTVQIAMMNFCRGLDWPPAQGLADYIKEVKRIQDSLMDTVWLGEVLGHEQVRMREPLAYGIEYNVLRNRKTGRRACILTNSGRDAAKQVVEGFDGGSTGRIRILTPFRKPKVVKLPAEVEIPGERIVFVEEL